MVNMNYMFKKNRLKLKMDHKNVHLELRSFKLVQSQIYSLRAPKTFLVKKVQNFSNYYLISKIVGTPLLPLGPTLN